MNALKRSFVLLLALITVLSLFSACVPHKLPSGPDGIEGGDTLKNNDSSEETTEKKKETASAPDPDFYLNTAPDSTVGEYRLYSFKGDPTDAAKAYVSLLQKEYGMELIGTDEDGTTLGWHLQKGKNEDADVDLSINCTGGISWEMWISFGPDVTLTCAETWDEPIIPTISGPSLPNPDAFFDYRLARNEDFYSTKKEWYLLSFKADIDTGSLAMEEYVSLLFDEKLDLELLFEEEETILYLHQHYFGFRYTGEEDVPDVYDDYRDFSADLLVYIQRNGQTETSLLTFHYKPDTFEFIDFGDRSTYSPVDCSGKDSGSSSPDSSDNNGSHQECSHCDGSGKCQTCDGHGYLYSSASDKNDRNCYKCHPNYGKCPYCHGSGKRN